MNSMFAAARAALCAVVALSVGETVLAKQREVRLPVLQTRVLGQNQWLAGSKVSLRVITQDYLKHSPISRAAVRIAYAVS